MSAQCCSCEAVFACFNSCLSNVSNFRSSKSSTGAEGRYSLIECRYRSAYSDLYELSHSLRLPSLSSSACQIGRADVSPCRCAD